jgi:glycosyltransferase involved in cell wall biosynthesis
MRDSCHQSDEPNEKHSILFDARLILDKPTGIGQYIASLIPELLQAAPDWHVYLLRRPDPWASYGIQNWQAANLTHHVITLPHMALRQYLVLPHLARNLGVDLIHYPHFDAPVLLGSTPVVATIHDVKYLAHPEFFTDLARLKRWYMYFCFAQTLRRAAAVIAVSEATAQDLCIFDVDGQRPCVIYEAVSSRFRPANVEQQTALREKYGLERPFILSVGERRPHKNHAGLIHAFAQSQSQQTHDLVIVGQVYHGYDEAAEMARKMGIGNHVHFLTEVDDGELVAIHTTADLFVLVSLYEGFGLPILEAMACGTPVIASSTTASGEIVGSGGVQVDPRDPAAIADAIDQMLCDAVLRHFYVERGYERCRQFTWQRTAQKTLALYRQVLNDEANRR